MPITDAGELRTTVDSAVQNVQLTDLHTHLYPPCFGDLLLWGIDDLISYHYLVAETFRWIDLPYDDYWNLSTREQADLIWKTLFLDNSPLAESNRGVLTLLQNLGLDVASRDLAAYRSYFASLTPEAYIDIVFQTANIKDVIMTNDPFDEAER
ncbi:MAG TPA: glucuronate isomerase, partial [Armatimonadota bacterium]|nr:glucuronate isomerase [Armatimonadota bacterium]